MVHALRERADEDSVNGQVFHLFADSTNGEDVNIVAIFFGSLE
jgi:hypothetical protein